MTTRREQRIVFEVPRLGLPLPPHKDPREVRQEMRDAARAAPKVRNTQPKAEQRELPAFTPRSDPGMSSSFWSSTVRFPAPVSGTKEPDFSILERDSTVRHIDSVAECADSVFLEMGPERYKFRESGATPIVFVLSKIPRNFP